MDVLSHLREHQLRSMCTTARYERHEAHRVLFYPHSISTCWYILLSGSVFMKESMFLPRCCFGKQSGGRRGCECIILEPSEMIVVENTNENEENALQREDPHRQSRRRFTKVNPKGERQIITDNVESSSYPPDYADNQMFRLAVQRPIDGRFS
ncbi:rap guanine nucleotide exchange factor 6-like isoform X1 [Acipenser oxyrinchus oxyrinchus]|uniref:Rap guanine nucleotide exchange factor 6-like isoform X1 n=1 Tax=Acipenser oxyrinchus oxyrinchus TaxID=40147 RepID=A0AAD8CIP9_ACIOX|nr:rap guanine nucleotide exchange factor 6-like isoform X1 [Acipenser oxyrinchus oxyrinchus]